MVEPVPGTKTYAGLMRPIEVTARGMARADGSRTMSAARVRVLLPASMMVADMAPDNVGTWLFHCHVNDHINGMLTRHRVEP